MKHHNTQPTSVHEHQRPPSITWAAGEACAHQRATTNHRKGLSWHCPKSSLWKTFSARPPARCHNLAGRNPNSLSGSVEGTGSPSKFIVIQENFVDQQVVKQGLLYGLTQGQLAKGLGMSKRDVNRLARFPYIACRSI